jgi:hypothetical protein
VIYVRPIPLEMRQSGNPKKFYRFR